MVANFVLLCQQAFVSQLSLYTSSPVHVLSSAVQLCCEDVKGMSEEGFESVVNWVSVYGVWLPSLSLLMYQCLNKTEYRVSCWIDS